MKSLAIKNDSYELTSPGSSNKEFYPSLSVTEKQIPELADMSIGDECEITVKVRITGMNSDNNGTRINMDCIEAEYVQPEEAQESEETDESEN